MNIKIIIKRTVGWATIFVLGTTIAQFIFPNKSLEEIFVILILFSATITVLVAIALFVNWCFDD